VSHPGAEDWMRPLGSTGIRVSALAAGGSSYDGSRPAREGGDPRGVQPILDLLASPIRTIDTSAAYGDGESERRIGTALAEVGGLPDGVTVTTKVAARRGRFTGDSVRRSIDASKQRLGLSELPLVYLHDPEFHEHSDVTEPGGPLDTLIALRAEGQIGHLGLAGGYLPEMERYLDYDVFDVLLVHNRWTLVDRSANGIIDRAVERGTAVVNAAVYGGGILASPEAGIRDYGYRPAHPAVLAAVAGMHEVCRRHGIPLSTAALQFSLCDPRISATVVGMSTASRIAAALEAAATPIPVSVQEELESWTPVPEFWMDATSSVA
jgi:D-threo-aldose 1-dehydrogenase